MGNLQIKDVPAELHAELKRRAAEAGMSQRDFVLQLLRREFRRPSKAEFLRRLRADPPAPPGLSGAELVRLGREDDVAELKAMVDRMISREADADADHRP